MGRIVTFGIDEYRLSNQPDVCDDYRLILGLDDRVSKPDMCDEYQQILDLDDRVSKPNMCDEYRLILGLDDSVSKTSLHGLCMCVWVVLGFIRDMGTSNNNWT